LHSHIEAETRAATLKMSADDVEVNQVIPWGKKRSLAESGLFISIFSGSTDVTSKDLKESREVHKGRGPKSTVG
jgi:hypothetical protein